MNAHDRIGKGPWQNAKGVVSSRFGDHPLSDPALVGVSLIVSSISARTIFRHSGHIPWLKTAGERRLMYCYLFPIALVIPDLLAVRAYRDDAPELLYLGKGLFELLVEAPEFPEVGVPCYGQGDGPLDVLGPWRLGQVGRNSGRAGPLKKIR